MESCIIAEITGSIGQLYLAGSSKAVWRDSQPGKVVFHVAVGGQVETSQELREIEDEVEASVPNSQAFLNARFQYVQRWNYYFSNSVLERGSDGYITTGAAGVTQDQVGLTTWFSYDLNTTILSHYNGIKFNLGSLPNLPSGIKIVGGLAIAQLTEYNLGPNAVIEQLSVDHNVRQGGENGMLIHVDFVTHNMLNRDGLILVQFESAQGQFLKDFNGEFTTSDGVVATSSKIKPGFQHAQYTNESLFFPYRELHLADGAHELRLAVNIYDIVSKKYVGSSQYQYFTITWG